MSRLICLFLIGMMSVAPVFADTPVFVPETGNLISSSFHYFSKYGPSEAVFQNPSRLPLLKEQLVALESGGEVLGYTPVRLSYGVTVPWMGSLAFGYFSYQANDNLRSPQAQTGERPVTTGTFSHGFQEWDLAWGKAWTENVSLGAHFQVISQVLDSDSASATSLDFGTPWRPWQFFELGCYTKNLLATPFQWTQSGAKEALPTRVQLSVASYLYSGGLGVFWDGDTLKGVAEWRPHPSFSLQVEGVKNSQEWIRYGVGAQLDFGSGVLAYKHDIGLLEGVSTDRDWLSLLFPLP